MFGVNVNLSKQFQFYLVSSTFGKRDNRKMINTLTKSLTLGKTIEKQTEI